MHAICVAHNHCVFWNVVTLVHKIFSHCVWSSEPKRIVISLDFLDDGATVGKVSLVFDCGQPISAYDFVELVVGIFLYFRATTYVCGEPLDEPGWLCCAQLLNN